MTHKEKYQEIIQQQGLSLPLFYQPKWLNALGVDGQTAISRDGEKLTGVWPYSVEKKAGITVIRNPLLSPYFGPLILPHAFTGYSKINHEEKVLMELFRQLPKYGSLNFSTPPDFLNFLPFHHEGIQERLKITYTFDLTQPEETLLKAVQTRTRRYIQNPAPGTNIEELTSIPEHFFRLHQETYERKNTSYPYTQSFLSRLVHQSVQQQFGKFYCLSRQQQPKSYLWVAYDDTCMYQLLSCYEKDKGLFASIPLLIWHALREAQKMGLTIFDMEGSVDPGIEPFFRKFGGNRKYYLSFSHTPSKIWTLKRKILG